MKLRKIGIVEGLKKSSILLGIKLIKKVSHGVGVFELYELADALGLEEYKTRKVKKTPAKKSKITAHRKAVPNPRGRRPKAVVQYSKSGEYIDSFACSADAAKKYSISTQAIRRCAKGDQKTAAGYQWRYR